MVRVSASATLVGDDYTWVWESEVRDRDGGLRAESRQSTFRAAPLSPEDVHERSETFVPTRTRQLLADADLFALVDGRRTLGDIARELMRLHPGDFMSWRDALTHAADVLNGR